MLLEIKLALKFNRKNSRIYNVPIHCNSHIFANLCNVVLSLAFYLHIKCRLTFHYCLKMEMLDFGFKKQCLDNLDIVSILKQEKVPFYPSTLLVSILIPSGLNYG